MPFYQKPKEIVKSRGGPATSEVGREEEKGMESGSWSQRRPRASAPRFRTLLVIERLVWTIPDRAETNSDVNEGSAPPSILQSTIPFVSKVS